MPAEPGFDWAGVSAEARADSVRRATAGDSLRRPLLGLHVSSAVSAAGGLVVYVLMRNRSATWDDAPVALLIGLLLAFKYQVVAWGLRRHLWWAWAYSLWTYAMWLPTPLLPFALLCLADLRDLGTRAEFRRSRTPASD